MVMLYQSFHLTIQPAVLVSLLTLLGGIVGALQRRKTGPGKPTPGNEVA